MLTQEKKNRLEVIALTIGHLRGSKTKLEGEIQRLAATVTKAILDGRDPHREHAAKKDELAAIDAEIAKLQAEAREMVLVILDDAHAACRERHNILAQARRNAGEKLREFLVLWFAIDEISTPFGDKKSRQEFAAYLTEMEKRFGSLQILASQRIDPNDATPAKPTWHAGCLRKGDGDELLRIMVKELTGFPFRDDVHRA